MRWSAVEDRVLRRRYAQGAPLRLIAAQLGRSYDAVAERRRTLGIRARPRSRPWSAGDDRLVRGAAAIGLAAPAIAARLERSPDQVRRRRTSLVGARPAGRAFTAADDRAIAAAWARDGDVGALARTLGRSAGSVRLRAQQLGAHRPPRRRRWRPDEDAIVRDGYARGVTCAEIAAELGDRTPAAVAARAAKLGLATYARIWTPLDDRRLRALVAGGTELERAAQLLARTPEGLRARARKLAIPAPRSARSGHQRRRWTRQEDERLALHAGLNPAVLAELLDRSPEAISRRLRTLGLRAGAQRSPHHPVTGRGEPTPGQRAAAARELAGAGAGRRLALARRLELAPAEIRRLARTAQDTFPTGPLRD